MDIGLQDGGHGPGTRLHTPAARAKPFHTYDRDRAMILIGATTFRSDRFADSIATKHQTLRFPIADNMMTNKAALCLLVATLFLVASSKAQDICRSSSRKFTVKLDLFASELGE